MSRAHTSFKAYFWGLVTLTLSESLSLPTVSPSSHHNQKGLGNKVPSPWRKCTPRQALPLSTLGRCHSSNRDGGSPHPFPQDAATGGPNNLLGFSVPRKRACWPAAWLHNLTRPCALAHRTQRGRGPLFWWTEADWVHGSRENPASSRSMDVLLELLQKICSGTACGDTLIPALDVPHS